MYFKKYVILNVCFIIVLLIVRVIWSNSFNYVFLLWNLLLAYIPVVLSKWMYQNKTINQWQIIKWVAFICWLVFLPNAPYIITDLMHLHYNHNAPKYFDIVLVFVCAFTGLVFYIVSIMQMERWWKKQTQLHLFWLYVATFFLTSFGIYLGRYMRFNSWELLTHPSEIVSQIIHRVVYPLQHPRTWAVTSLYAIALLLIYKTVHQGMLFFSNQIAIYKEQEATQTN
jgi:uncharacterized membrane protein